MVVKDEDRNKASNIIISALGDNSLRVVRLVIGDPSMMMAKLDARYSSKTVEIGISNLDEIIYVRYKSFKSDISKQLDCLDGLIEEMRAMGTSFDNALAIGILLSSIKKDQLIPTTSAIEKLSDKDLNWEDECRFLIDDVRTVRNTNNGRERSSAAIRSCDICKKIHRTKDVYCNPSNSPKKLNLSPEAAYAIKGKKTRGKTNMENFETKIVLLKPKRKIKNATRWKSP